MRVGTMPLYTVSEAVLPSVVDQSAFGPGTMDQGPYGGCVGHARAGAITLAMSAAGTPLGWVVSPGTMYALPRCLERAMNTPAGMRLPDLTDDGTYPSLAHLAITEWGVVPMGKRLDGRFSDCGGSDAYGHETICDEPDLQTIGRCAETLLPGEYAITGSAAQRGLAVRQALAHGFPVERGGLVDTAFMDWSKPDEAFDCADPTDPDGGGHDMYILGYREVEKGVFWYDVQNSWGTWGRNGRIWVTENFLAASQDLNALSVRRA